MWFIALALGSDHFDGGNALKKRSHDITDVYAWVEGGDRSTLAIAMNVHPYAKKTSRFSPDLTYRLDIRRASIDGTGEGTDVQTSEAWFIDCHATETGESMRCRLHPDGPHCRGCERVLTMPFGDRAGGAAPGIRGFAGPIIDPFFIDTRRVSRARPREGQPQDRASVDVTENAMVRARVMSLVFEIDVQEIFGADGLFSVSGRTMWVAHLPDVPRLSR